MKTTVWSRVSGYCRPTSSWNRGKQQEFKDRKEFVIDLEKPLTKEKAGLSPA
jgi:ribonucleoside-triphosphate reductase